MIRDAWRLAVGTLTAVPIAPPLKVDRPRARLAMLLAPIAVLPLAILSALVVAAGHFLELSPFVTAVLAIGLLVLGNRAFHIDGLADVVDAMAASYDKDRSLEVMKTGTSGPAGVVAIVLVLALQVAAVVSLLNLIEWWRAAILVGAVVCVSRTALVFSSVRGIPSARESGLGNTFAETISPVAAFAVWLSSAVVLAAFATWAGLEWWRGLLAALLSGLLVFELLRRAVRRFGGVTGDVYGAAVELSLAALLVSLS